MKVKSKRIAIKEEILGHRGGKISQEIHIKVIIKKTTKM
jgi:hypothetical protein